MTTKDLELLVKMMNLTTSENDHEALVALRKANALIKKFSKTWETLIRGESVKIPRQDQYRPTTNWDDLNRWHEEFMKRQQARQQTRQQEQQTKPPPKDPEPDPRIRWKRYSEEWFKMNQKKG